MYKQYKLHCTLFVASALLFPPLAAGQTFARDIAPVVYAHCGQCHHPAGTAPFSLLTYQAVRQHATQIAELTRNRLMPPWNAQSEFGEFVGLHRLSDAEIDLFRQWTLAGAPEGDLRDLPAAPTFNDAWQLGQPDLIVTFPQPYLLKSEGPDESRVFVLPLPASRMRFVRGIEFHPGNSRVHHANIRIDRTPASRQLDEADPAPGYDGVILHSAVYPDGHFLGWTPGQAPPLLPKGLAWRLEPDSTLVVQLHMVPSGRAERIQPSIGLYFTDDPPERTPSMLRLAVQDINIEPGDGDYTVADSFVLPVDADLLALQPHAHYLAREVKGLATFPDGSTRTLISIPDWDLRWQHVYRFETPVTLPKGTTVSMRYVYDNSLRNPRNPNQPPRHIYWGQRSEEEMGDLWLQLQTHTDRDRALLQDPVELKMIATDTVGYEELIKRDPSRAQLHDDVAVLYLALDRPVDAVRHFEAVSRLKPQSAPAHFNLATALTSAGQLDRAITEYRQALALQPSYARAHNNLGAVLLTLNRPGEASAEFREAVRLEPGNSEAHLNLGALLRVNDQSAAAIGEFREAVRTQPDSVSALAALASMLATDAEASLRRPAEAVTVAERAATLTARQDASTLDILAAAYAANGDFERAVAVAGEALALSPPAALAAAIRARQELYKQRKTYIKRRD